MAPRNKRKKCGNCPEPVITPVVKRPPEPKTVTVALYATVEDTEAQRLWKHVCFGASSCVSMIEGYAQLGLPGDPTEAVEQMRDRLDTVLQSLRSRKSHAVHPEPAAERLSPAGEDHGDAPEPAVDVVDAGRLPQDDGPGPA